MLIDKKPPSYTALANQVRDNGGLCTVYMWVLRDLQEQDRLGSRVIDAIKSTLDSSGLEGYPSSLSNRQYDKVLLVSKDHLLSKVFKCLDAITDDTDDKLAAILGDGKPQQTLDRIRMLVGA